MKRKEPEPGCPAFSLTYLEQIRSMGQRHLGPGAPEEAEMHSGCSQAAQGSQLNQ